MGEKIPCLLLNELSIIFPLAQFLSHILKLFHKSERDQIKERYSHNMLSMCMCRYWWGYLKLLKRMNNEEELLKVELQLCDVDLLEDKKYG